MVGRSDYRSDDDNGCSNGQYTAHSRTQKPYTRGHSIPTQEYTGVHRSTQYNDAYAHNPFGGFVALAIVALAIVVLAVSIPMKLRNRSLRVSISCEMPNRLDGIQ